MVVTEVRNTAVKQLLELVRDECREFQEKRYTIRIFPEFGDVHCQVCTDSGHLVMGYILLHKDKTLYGPYNPTMGTPDSH